MGQSTGSFPDQETIAKIEKIASLSQGIEEITRNVSEQKVRTETLESYVGQTRDEVSQVGANVAVTRQEVSQVSEKVDQLSDNVNAILAKKGFFNWIGAALGIIGGILTVGLVILLGLDKSVPEGYIAIITTVIGALAGSLIPQR